MTKPQSRKLRAIISIALNGFIFLCSAYLVTDRVINGSSGGPGDMITYGLAYLKYFTNESNVLGGISSLIIVIFNIRSLITGREEMPGWAISLHLMATTCLLLTFATTALFLAPSQVLGGRSYFSLFTDDMHFFHLVNPLFSICSFILLQRTHIFSRRDTLLGIIPMFLYSILYLLMVAILKEWKDFYGFTFGGKYYLIPLVLIVMYGVTYILTRILIRLHNHGLEEK